MEQSIFTVLPDLAIGVVSVLSLVFVTVNFTRTLDQRSLRHEEAMAERENNLREVEREVRTNILAQLSKNTEIMNETTKTLERVMNHLDKPR